MPSATRTKRKLSVSLLVSLYVRYAVVSGLEVSNLEDVVYDVAKKLWKMGILRPQQRRIDGIKRPTMHLKAIFNVSGDPEGHPAIPPSENRESLRRQQAGKTRDIAEAARPRTRRAHLPATARRSVARSPGSCEPLRESYPAGREAESKNSERRIHSQEAVRRTPRICW